MKIDVFKAELNDILNRRGRVPLAVRNLIAEAMDFAYELSITEASKEVELVPVVGDEDMINNFLKTNEVVCSNNYDKDPYVT